MENELVDATPTLLKIAAQMAALNDTLERVRRDLRESGERTGRLANRILELEPIVCAIHGTETNLEVLVIWDDEATTSYRLQIEGCCDSVRARALESLRNVI